MKQILLSTMLAWAAFAAQAEPGHATRDIELKAEPAGGARVVGTVQKGAKFEIVGEKGPWSQVKAGGAEGWALSFYVMKGEPAAQTSMGTRLSEVWSLGTERRSETTATIGIRGLDEEQLKSAQFNAQELRHLEALSLPKAEGEAFAMQGRLIQQQVNYFPSPNATPVSQQ